MNKNLKSKNDGFTIIEVLIVLAIAALIMLIVFIAVPALRRNARNTEIRNNAARVATAAVEFRTNANGQVPTTAAHGTTIAQMANVPAVAMGAGATATPATYRVIGANGSCDGTTAASAGTDPRAVAVQFGLEGGGTGCIVN